MRVARISDTDLQQLDEAPVGIRRAAALFKGHFWATLLVSVIIAASALISLAQPFLLRAVIDDALPHGNTTLLVKLVVGMVVVAILTGILGVWQTWLATKVGQQVMHDLRTKVFSHVQSLSIDFFKRTRSGEIQARITQDIAGLQSVITTTATSIASNLTTAIATAAAMVALSWQLSLLTLLVLPPALWGTRRVALVRRDITSTKQRVLADLYSQVEESLSVSGAQLSKTLGAAARSEAKYVEISEQLIGLELRSQLAGRWRMATMQTVFAVIPALIYLAAGFPGAAGDVSIGTRLARSSRVVRGPRREFISRAYNLILRGALGARFSDAQCGFKAIRADVARELVPLVEDRAWFFDSELLVLAERCRLRIHEVPVDWYDDPDSRVDVVGTARDDLAGVWRLRRALGRGTLPVDDIARRMGRLPPTHALRGRVESAQAANTAALLLATVFNTWANRRYTFGLRGPGGMLRQQSQGLGIVGVTWAFTAASLAALHALAPHADAVLETAVVGVATAAATVAKFGVMRRWVFGRRGRR